MRTKNELYQEALRTVARRRQTARARAEDARAEAEAALPGLRRRPCGRPQEALGAAGVQRPPGRRAGTSLHLQALRGYRRGEGAHL